MSVGKVCGYVQISVARCTNTGGASAAPNGTLLFLALAILYEWQRLMCCSTHITSRVHCSSLEVSDCRRVISKSTFSLRSFSHFQSLTCLNPVVWTQRLTNVLPPLLHPSVHTRASCYHNISDYQMGFKCNRLDRTCCLSQWWIIFVIARFYQFAIWIKL